MNPDVENELRRQMREAMRKMQHGEQTDDGWDAFMSSNTPEDFRKAAQKKPETPYEQYRRLLKDWEPHFSESSSKRIFIDVINLICKKLRERGLYVKVATHDTEKATFLVSYDTPNAPEQKFDLYREDNQNYIWRKQQSTRHSYYYRG